MSAKKDSHQLELMDAIFGIIAKRDLSIDQQTEGIVLAIEVVLADTTL